MRKFLLALVLFSFSVLPASAQDNWGDIIKKLENSMVFLDSGCSGNVINEIDKYVLTAAHCLPDDGKPLFVDRVQAEIVAKDIQKDLAVLYVKHLDPSRKALKLAASNPAIGDTVMSGGFGYALERALFRKAMISDTAVTITEVSGGPYIAIDAPFIGGMSGSAVTNHDGEIVLIVQRSSNAMGIGVGAEVIRERVGRFFATR